MSENKSFSRPAAILASINIALLSGVAYYLIKIDAIGSRTSIEVLSAMTLALVIFVVIPIKFIAIAKTPQLQNSSKDRLTLRILAFFLLLVPPAVFVILLSRELSIGKLTSHEQQTPKSISVILKN